MKFHLLYFAILIASCSNTSQFNKINSSAETPISEAININTTHTDSGVVSTKLISNKMLNFSNNKFPYFEFPEKIQIVLYDKNMSETKIFSDYAISYSDTDLIDLRGNVVVSTPLKDTLFSEQLYYSSEMEWLFTDFNFRYVSENKDIYGKGFNSDKEFKNVTFSDVSGYLSIEE